MLRLKRILDMKGLSTGAAANAIGISEKSMYNKLTGATEFTYKQACLLRGVLPEYNIDFLLSEEIPIDAPPHPVIAQQSAQGIHSTAQTQPG